MQSLTEHAKDKKMMVPEELDKVKVKLNLVFISKMLLIILESLHPSGVTCYIR